MATQKGGTGKTLVCQVLICALAGDLRVVALDADPNGALSRWAGRAYEGPPFEAVAEADETRLAHLIAAKADAADLVLVDTAGFGNRAATVAMTSADGVIVPARQAGAIIVAICSATVIAGGCASQHLPFRRGAAHVIAPE